MSEGGGLREMEVNEMNKLREKLGLPPLVVEQVKDDKMDVKEEEEAKADSILDRIQR